MDSNVESDERREESLEERSMFPYICIRVCTVGPRLSKHLCATSILKVFRYVSDFVQVSE